MEVNQTAVWNMTKTYSAQGHRASAFGQFDFYMMLGLLTFIGVLFLIIVLCVTKCFRKCWPDRRQSADLPAITPLKFTDFLDSYYYLNPFGRFDDFYYDLNRNSPAVN